MDCTCDNGTKEPIFPSYAFVCVSTYSTWKRTHAPPTHHTLFTTLTPSTLAPTHTHILLHAVKVIKKLHTQSVSQTVSQSQLPTSCPCGSAGITHALWAVTKQKVFILPSPNITHCSHRERMLCVHVVGCSVQIGRTCGPFLFPGRYVIWTGEKATYWGHTE